MILQSDETHKRRCGDNNLIKIYPLSNLTTSSGWWLSLSGDGCARAIFNLAQVPRKAEGWQLGNRATGGQGGRGRAGQLAGGGQRAALGEGEDAQQGKGEGRGAGKEHSVQP